MGILVWRERLDSIVQYSIADSSIIQKKEYDYVDNIINETFIQFNDFVGLTKNKVYLSNGKVIKREGMIVGDIAHTVLNYKYDGNNLTEVVRLNRNVDMEMDTLDITKYSYEAGILKEKSLYVRSLSLGVFLKSEKSLYSSNGSIKEEELYWNSEIIINKEVLKPIAKYTKVYSDDKIISMSYDEYDNDTWDYNVAYSYMYSDSGYTQKVDYSTHTVTIEYEKLKGNDKLLFDIDQMLEFLQAVIK